MKKYNSRRTWMKGRTINLKIGYLLALIFVFFAFQWEVHEKPTDFNTWVPVFEAIENDVVRTAHKKKEIPPVKMKREVREKFVLDLSDISIDDDSDPDDIDDFVDENDIFENIVKSIDTISAEPKRVAPVVAKEEPFIFFPSRMPTFGDCTDISDEKERRACSDKALNTFIYKELRYPDLARESSITGRAVAEIIIDKTGKVTGIKILRDLGGGIGQEVSRVLHIMPDWSPGKQLARPVNVKITIPIRFELN